MRALLVAIACFLAIHSASALTYGDVMGTWRGTLIQSGVGGTFSMNVTMRIVPFKRNGLLLRSIIVLPQTTAVEYRRFNGNGRADQAVYIQNQFYSGGSGAWTVGRTTLREAAKLTYWEGTEMTERFTLVFHGKWLSYRSTYSGGARITGVLRRR